MAYDPKIGRTVLFGGQGSTFISGQAYTYFYFNDTWTYDGKTWTKQSPPTSPPGYRVVAMAYDEAIGRIVLVGLVGESAGTMTGETWTFDGTTWTQQHSATIPSARRPVMAYDAAIGKLVLLAGDTWTYDGTTWTRVSMETPHVYYEYGPLTYDAALRKLVLYGVRYGGDAATWTYDGTTWAEQPGSSTTPPRIGGWALAYDAALRRTVLFGGTEFKSGMRNNYGGPLNDTLTYDSRTWTQQHPATAPTPRSDGLMVYDPALNALVLFGGEGFSPQPSGGESYGQLPPETWTYGPLTEG